MPQSSTLIIAQKLGDEWYVLARHPSGQYEHVRRFKIETRSQEVDRHKVESLAPKTGLHGLRAAWRPAPRARGCLRAGFLGGSSSDCLQGLSLARGGRQPSTAYENPNLIRVRRSPFWELPIPPLTGRGYP